MPIEKVPQFPHIIHSLRAETVPHASLIVLYAWLLTKVSQNYYIFLIQRMTYFKNQEEIIYLFFKNVSVLSNILQMSPFFSH